MDLLHEQIAILNAKVDALHESVSQLSTQTNSAISELKVNSTNRVPYSQSGGSARSFDSYGLVGFSQTMEHKDILVDSEYLDSESQVGEQTLSSEIQVQRLTAQLTAAYNRIAALEEQLLARRVH
ncbi:MAG: hypothetical protein ACFE0J_25270 [Elainellaceae cyanobacterium]